MGLAIKELLAGKEISFEELKGKVLAVDTFNMLYQFLTTIRSADGSPLSDSNGNITSHLVGLFSRVTNLMQKDLRLCFVFDGKAPELKERERVRRKELKIEAGQKYEEAKQKEDIEQMKKYAARTARLTKEIIEEAKNLLSALGFPIVQAASEGEAQCAYMAKKGDCFAAVSQDFDSLLQGAPRLVRNLSIAGRKKQSGKLNYLTIKPEILNLNENLASLGIDSEQLISLAMLVGTDYNVGGIKGIGPKKAIDLVKKYGHNLEALFNDTKWDTFFDYPWTDVYETIKNIPVSDDYSLKWHRVDDDKVKELLVEQHDFNLERVNSTLDKLSSNKMAQKGLGEFF
ncbi:flap endonuclease-1 [Candidatus Woesearchaeota archaeon]|nr:flap endonuclease-1 [Candidatus Woesearchaeota archaeon]